MYEKIKGLVLESKLLGKRKDEKDQWFKIVLETDRKGRKLNPGSEVEIEQIEKV